MKKKSSVYFYHQIKEELLSFVLLLKFFFFLKLPIRGKDNSNGKYRDAAIGSSKNSIITISNNGSVVDKEIR